MAESIRLDVEDVDLFQFVDAPFKIRVKMVDTVSGSVKLGQFSTIKVLLGFEGNTTSDTRCREHHPHLLEVVSNTGIREDGYGAIEVKITDVSMNHDHQRFVVYLEVYRTHGENNILLAATNPITCVRHKLVITEKNSQPYIWYKDEGAKDKCIKVLVQLIDASQNIVKERNVPLAVSLVYSSGQTVQPATVLSIFNDKDKPLMIASTGSELVKFRVNEVSRNHRKQLFHLLVAPDISQDSSLSDVSPATSVAFEVKSKRTSDARKEHANQRGEDDDSTDAIPLPQSRLNELASVQPLKRMKLDTFLPSTNGSGAAVGNIGGTMLPGTSGAGIPGVGNIGIGLGINGVTSKGDLSSGRGGSNDFKGAMDPANRMMNSGGIPGMAAGLAGKGNMIGATGMGMNLFGNPSSLGMRDDIPEELSYEIPFKAIYSLAEWTNVAVNALSAAGHVLNSIDSHDSYNSNAREIQQSIIQLVESYPGRAHSCLQYLQQFLALQEQRTLQQIQLLAMMQQEQKSFRLQLDSLIPQRGTGQSNVNTVMPGLIGVQRTNGGLSLGSTGAAMNGLTGSMLGGSNLQGNMNVAFQQQQQVAAAAQQVTQQQQQLMNAANLLSRGMRRDGSSNGSNNTALGSANSRQLGSNSNEMIAGNSVLNRAALQTQQMQQQLQSLQQLAAAAIVDFNSSGINSVSSGTGTTPNSSITQVAPSNFLNSGNGANLPYEVHPSEAAVTNILGKRIFLSQENELLGLPAFSSGPDLRLLGFYLEDNSMRLSNDGEANWKYRPIEILDAFQDEDRAQVLSKLILDQWKDPNNRQDGICFDVSSFEGNLPAMKKSIVLILKELEENEVSNTHFLSA